MIKLPILYSFRRCPYAMRARMALHYAKIAHEHREISLKIKPAQMLKMSPKGTVPILLLPDGQLLEQSLEIMIWAMGTRLSNEDRAIINENDSIFKEALDRYKYADRYEEACGINYRDICLLFVGKVENRLSPFLSGETPTLVDMALFPFIRQFARVDPEWFEAQSFPRLKEWLDFFIRSVLFAQVMEKYPLWVDENSKSFVRP